MDLKLITPILFAVLVAWGIVRRVRRSFGRQPVQVKRIWFRIALLTVVGGIVFATSAARSAQILESLVVGLACGAALAYFGLRHTQFEVTPAGRFYTPHTYVGLAVTALFIARLLYRFLYLFYDTHTATDASQYSAVTYQRSPLTLGIFAAVVGYYLLFNAGVLVRSRAPAQPPARPGE